MPPCFWLVFLTIFFGDKLLPPLMPLMLWDVYPAWMPLLTPGSFISFLVGEKSQNFSTGEADSMSFQGILGPRWRGFTSRNATTSSTSHEYPHQKLLFTPEIDSKRP